MSEPLRRPLRVRPALITPRTLPLALAQAGLLLGGWAHVPGARAQVDTSATRSTPPATGGRAMRANLPLFFEADELSGESGKETRASGRVRLQQGDLRINANQLTHDVATNTAYAKGQVRIVDAGNIYVGPSLTLKLDTEVGAFEHPRFWLARTKAGGQAERVEFMGHNKVRAEWTTYSSCTPENTADGQPGEPDWALKTDRVDLDLDANVGTAKGAVIWFKGVPVLAAPSISFPLDNSRKSGLLPPSFDYDSKSGFEYSQPYYWNIAPAQDMTLIPTLSARRGVSLDTEYRYLLPSDKGNWRVVARPDDRVADRARGLVDLEHQGAKQDLLGSGTRTDYDLQWLRVSDDDYWKDFNHNLPSRTPRLYDSHARFEHSLNARNWGLGDSQTEVYGSVQSYQTLKDLDPTVDPTLSSITTPYRRTPQLGIRSRGLDNDALNWSVGSEFNRFTNSDTSQVSGNRLQVQGEVSRPYRYGGLQFTPKVSVRSTSYDLDTALSDGSRSITRTIPTVSLDGRATFERPVQWFGRDSIQTLEPRVQYVRTPYQDQSMLPLFDTAARDFNQDAIFSENAYTGGDRVNDANQVTMGVTSRLLDARTGAEAMRLGVVQKVLLADQRINPDGTEPITQRLSDLLILGSTAVIPNWWLDGYTQFAGQNHQVERGLLSVRYSPSPWRTVNVNYRYTRDSTEQIELGWQWPLSGRTPRDNAARREQTMGRMLGDDNSNTRDQAVADPMRLGTGASSRSNGDCSGAWYSVGRLSYSARDRRMTDAIIGTEYDAGCWIGRVVAQRITVSNTVTTRLMFQIELVGLSRISLGSNPLKSLKDNIPGYRLLQDDSQAATTLGEVPLLDDE